VKWIAVLSATLSIAFSGAALAMSYPVYVDSVCDTMREARATPGLKAWMKGKCPKGEASPDPACGEFARFIRDVAANNENWRRKCGGAS